MNIISNSHVNFKLWNKKNFIFAIISTLFLTSNIATSHAFIDDSGAASSSSEPAKYDDELLIHVSKQIEKKLAQEGAMLAIVYRAGRPPEDLPKGISFTHGAFWVYSNIPTTDGKVYRGYSVHNLYMDDEEQDRSYLKQDFPIDFVYPVKGLDFGVIIPKPELQKRILQRMKDGTYETLHNPNYSLVSNPNDLKYQNCNEFIINNIAAATWETDDIKQIKANLKKYHSPSLVDVGPLKSFFASIFTKNVKTNDHKGKIHTTTFKSTAEFMEKYDLEKDYFILKAEDLLKDYKPTKKSDEVAN